MKPYGVFRNFIAQKQDCLPKEASMFMPLGEVKIPSHTLLGPRCGWQP